jgi:hypothetical protein
MPSRAARSGGAWPSGRVVAAVVIAFVLLAVVLVVSSPAAVVPLTHP